MLPSERVKPFQWDCTAGVGGGGESEKGRVEMVSVYNWLGLLYCWMKSLLSAGTFSPIAVLKIYLPKGQVVRAFSVVRPKITCPGQSDGWEFRALVGDIFRSFSHRLLNFALSLVLSLCVLCVNLSWFGLFWKKKLWSYLPLPSFKVTGP